MAVHSKVLNSLLLPIILLQKSLDEPAIDLPVGAEDNWDIVVEKVRKKHSHYSFHANFGAGAITVNIAKVCFY